MKVTHWKALPLAVDHRSFNNCTLSTYWILSTD